MLFYGWRLTLLLFSQVYLALQVTVFEKFVLVAMRQEVEDGAEGSWEGGNLTTPITAKLLSFPFTRMKCMQPTVAFFVGLLWM